ncbi:DUF4198 domain-containing protein [Vibrio sp. SCSIO 43136]|uniref:DUF4198 domain-containing protein n=1 Tax=Vibrio sp. SCSIO 43136 TaxID=2819101 RepID=UPI0020755FC9|nr:DUF4198 domain-containing protein [Vibrio sp. SCSIO 43136]USD67111.1 DUF4198 domain-containing protein [Vibrio sp. SCSIO 43136]
MRHKSSIKAIGLACTLLAGGMVSTVVEAHPRWILPSHFQVSKQDGDWLTFDVTASHGTFVFDKPASADSARIKLPNGETTRPDYVMKGKRRSVFDFNFVEQGTHKVTVNGEPGFRTQYKAGRRNTVKWARASKADRASMLPEQARDITTTMYYTRVESYITFGQPTDKALELEKKYLEIKPITHPADIVEGEEVTFQMFFNGQAAAGVKVDVTRDGTMYRNAQEQIDVVSDKQGFVRFTPEQAGVYLLRASHKQDLDNHPLADKAVSGVHLTFEAVLQ